MKTRVVNKRSGEPYDIYIGRPSPFGNPFPAGVFGSRIEVIKLYREWVMKQPDLIKKIKRELTGKILACYCKPLACHGNVLVEICDSNPKNVTYRVVLSYCVAEIITNGRGRIIDTAPIFGWAKGKRLSEFKRWIASKHGKIRRIKGVSNDR